MVEKQRGTLAGSATGSTHERETRWAPPKDAAISRYGQAVVHADRSDDGLRFDFETLTATIRQRNGGGMERPAWMALRGSDMSIRTSNQYLRFLGRHRCYNVSILRYLS